jgi:hypothetical protein
MMDEDNGDQNSTAAGSSSSRRHTGPLRRRLSVMTSNLGAKHVALIEEDAIDEVELRKIDALITRFPVPPDSIPEKPTARDTAQNVVSGITTTASKGIGLVNKLVFGNTVNK